MSNYLNKNLVVNFLIILSIFGLDRITKEYVIFLDQQNFNSNIFSSSFVNIELIWNYGIAFGLFSSQENYIYNFITTLIVSIIFLLIYLSFYSKSFKKYSYFMVIGGALGNLYDRIVFSSVPDFIDIHYGEFHWFIFNVADIFITIGIICLIYDEVLLQKKNNEQNF